MRQISQRVESPGTYVTNEFHAAILLGHEFFRTALPYSDGYHLERGGMRLHNAVHIHCKRAQLLKIKVQVSSIWAKVCMFDDCVCYLT